MASLKELVGYLDDYLRISEVPDSENALNGLQVENTGSVGWIVAAVDASQATIDGVVAAAQRRSSGEPPLLLVHHGLFWDGNLPLAGRRYRRLRTLLEEDIAVYSAHIPLDVHPEVGNNAVLARILGLTELVPYDDYRGIKLGVAGSLSLEREALVARLDTALGTRARLIAGGPPMTRRVGVVTGAGGTRLRFAKEAACDTFVTGEGPHHTFFDALETEINLIYAGHYATEQVGVKALAQHLADRFGLLWEFHDHPTQM